MRTFINIAKEEWAWHFYDHIQKPNYNHTRWKRKDFRKKVRGEVYKQLERHNWFADNPERLVDLPFWSNGDICKTCKNTLEKGTVCRICECVQMT